MNVTINAKQLRASLPEIVRRVLRGERLKHDTGTFARETRTARSRTAPASLAGGYTMPPAGAPQVDAPHCSAPGLSRPCLTESILT